MRTVHRVTELTAALDAARASGRVVGLIPTMGALHAGHMSLLDAARDAGATFAVITVFVNPRQFGNATDLARYPRDLEADAELAATHGADLLFAPAEDEMYPPGFSTHVDVAGVTDRWEGAHRPGHFRGVATVVTKLLAMAAPCHAVFGEKDFQQCAVIARLVADLNLRVTISLAPTVRDPDGLAASSRNARLTAEARARALALPRGLAAAQRAFTSGTHEAEELIALAAAALEGAAESVDYIALVDPATLSPIPRARAGDRLLAAATFGGVRLIDNLALG